MKKKPTLHNLGARLRSLREARGLTQVQVAERAGFSQGHVANIERGVRGGPSIRFATLLALTRALDVTIDEVIDEGREPS